jgi:hypothetical protein
VWDRICKKRIIFDFYSCGIIEISCCESDLLDLSVEPLSHRAGQAEIEKVVPSGIFVGRCSAFSSSAAWYSYSKTPESIQVDHLFRKVETSVFGLFVNQIRILLFEYEYRFTKYEYEYQKNQWYELSATIMPDGPRSLLGQRGFASA